MKEQNKVGLIIIILATIAGLLVFYLGTIFTNLYFKL